MCKFLKETKGAVTVFVTLLLIPAMLVSGAAVDIARIHTAQSIVQDANQLAANAVLTQYNALLHDLYGLFGVMAEDPTLAEMVNEYIKISIFGEDWNDKSIGTLQLFYGSDLQPAAILPAPDKDLRSADVLQRQIEDYMKYRAPVIIVKEVLEALSSNKLKEDTKIIDNKLAIDSGIADLYDVYKKLYDAIANADKCNQAIGGVGGGYFGSVSVSLRSIHDHFEMLYGCYKVWERFDYSEDPDDPFDTDIKTEYEYLYAAVMENIKSLTIGGPRGSNWNGDSWGTVGNVLGLEYNITNAKNQADNFKSKFVF